MNGKKFWKSKMFWLNIIGLVGILLGHEVVDPQISGAILMVLNMVLRMVTKEPIVW